MSSAQNEPSSRRRRNRRRAHTLRDYLAEHPHNGRGALKRFARLLAVAVVVGYLVVPQLAGSRKSWHLLRTADVEWLLIALLLEILALLVYGLLSWCLLPTVGRPTYSRVLRIDLATLAVSHSVPAGSAVGLGLGYRLLTASGVPGPSAAAAKATQAIGSAVVLNDLLGVALVTTVSLHGAGSGYGIAAATGLALMLFAAVCTLALTRHESAVAGRLSTALGRLPFLSAASIRAAVGTVADYLRALTSNRRLLAQTGAIAALNWLLDAASLWACVRAFGHTLGPDGLLVPYGIANVLAAIPLTPGGVGIIEAFLIPALVGFSVPRGIAILGVLAWRVFNYLLPIPVGYAAYLTLPSAHRSQRPT